MRILNRPQTIANALRENTLTERDKLNFIWVILVVNSVSVSESSLAPFLRFFTSPLTALLQLLTLGIFIWGILASYRVNRRGDNRQFLERFVCLTAALSIRFYPCYWLFFLLYCYGYLPFLYVDWFLSSLIYILVVNGLSCYMYIRLRSLIAYVASPEETTLL